VQIKHAVDRKRFIREERKRGRNNRVVAVAEEKRMELESEAEGLSKRQKAIASSMEDVQIVTCGSNAKHGRRVGALGKGLHQRRPLQAVHDVEVKDVDGLLPFVYGFQDGLVGCQMAEPYEWGYLV
jgi:hypothetical protein